MHFPFVPLLDVTHFGGHSHKGWNCKCGFGLNFYNFSIRTYALWKHAIIIYYYADLERFLNQKQFKIVFWSISHRFNAKELTKKFYTKKSISQNRDDLLPIQVHKLVNQNQIWKMYYLAMYKSISQLRGLWCNPRTFS